MSTQPRPETPAATFHHFPLDRLSESKTNPRQHFDPAALQKLADSIRSVGVLEPLLVRPTKRNKKGQSPNYDSYEVVAGARRYRAGKLAEVAELPCIVRELTDQQALEIQIVENLQREDVHPLEEGEGYKTLLAQPGYTVPVIALKVGKDESYIYRRLQLTNLIQVLKGKFYAGEIGLQHALRISPLPPPAQLKVAKDGLFKQEHVQAPDGSWKRPEVAVSTASLDSFIRQHIMLELKKVPWKLDDPALEPHAGSCSNCPKRTGANHELFDDPKAGDRCLDGKCYESKMQAHVNLAIAAAKENGGSLIQVASSHMYPMPKHVLEHHAYTRVAAKKPCDFAQPAIVVGGNEGLGSQFLICKDKKCKVHAASHQGNYRPKPLTLGEQWKEKSKNLEARIAAATRHELLNGVIRKTPAQLTRTELEWVATTLIKRHMHDTTKELFTFFGLDAEAAKKAGLHISTAVTNYVLSARVKGPEKTGGRNWFTFNQCMLALTLIGEQAKYSWHGDKEPNLLDTAAKHYGIDEKQIRTAIAGPMRKKFEASKAAAFKREKENKKSGAKKPAAKKAIKLSIEQFDEGSDD